MADKTDDELRAEREAQAKADTLARSQDPSAMGNIEVAARNAGKDPADVAGTWQNQQREIARFNAAEVEARSKDPSAMGVTFGPGTYEYDKQLRAEQAAREADERAHDPSAMGRTDVARVVSVPSSPGHQQQQPTPAPRVATEPPKPVAGVQQAIPPSNQPQALLSMPLKGFTKNEREWLEKLVTAVNTGRAIPGRNISITETPGASTLINAHDCQPCA